MSNWRVKSSVDEEFRGGLGAKNKNWRERNANESDRINDESNEKTSGYRRGIRNEKNNNENWREKKVGDGDSFGEKTWRMRNSHDNANVRGTNGSSRKFKSTNERPERTSNNDSRKTAKPHIQRPMTDAELLHLIKNEAPPNVLFTILPREGSFFTLLQQRRLTGETICYVLQVLVKITTDISLEHRVILSEFLMRLLPQIVTHDHFLIHHLELFILQLNETTSEEYAQCEVYREAVEDLISFGETLHATLPTASADTLKCVLPLLQSQLLMINKKVEVFSSNEMERLDTLVDAIEATGSKVRDKIIAGNTEEEPPPENFRCIEINPTYDDIFNNDRPFLRENKVDGKYHDVEHYLDVQFRLLREDFVRPLRLGIQECAQRLRSGMSASDGKNGSVRVYNDVQISSTSFDPSDGALIFNATFDISRLRQVQWKVSEHCV